MSEIERKGQSTWEVRYALTQEERKEEKKKRTQTAQKQKQNNNIIEVKSNDERCRKKAKLFFFFPLPSKKGNKATIWIAMEPNAERKRK